MVARPDVVCLWSAGRRVRLDRWDLTRLTGDASVERVRALRAKCPEVGPLAGDRRGQRGRSEDSQHYRGDRTRQPGLGTGRSGDNEPPCGTTVTRVGERSSRPADNRPENVRLVTSRRTLPGRRFAPIAELQLAESMLYLAGSLAAANLVLAIPEFVGAFGVADLIAVVADPNLLQAREAAGIPPLTYEPDAAVVAALTAHRAQSLDDLAHRLGWPSQAVERRVPRLLRIGAIDRASSGGLVRHPALVPVGRTHAFEAKVRDWQRGRDQARRYRLWADTATLVMASVPSQAAVRADVARWGIGFAVHADWIRRPTSHRHNPSRRLVTSELVVGALFG
jgi:hypothetical protein